MGYKIFKEIFNSVKPKSSINRTVFKHKEENSEYKSPKNTIVWGGRDKPVAVVTKPLGEVIADLVYNRIGIAKVSDAATTFYFCQHQDEGWQSCYVFFQNTHWYQCKFNGIDTVTTLKSILAPIVVKIIDENSTIKELYQNLNKSFHTVIGDTEESKKYFFILHDELYYTGKEMEIYEYSLNDLFEQYKKEIKYEYHFNSSSTNNTILQTIKKFDCDFSLKNLIPSVPHIELPEKFKPLANAIVDGEVLATLFYGPTGSGKSTLVKKICETIGLPLVVINCTTNLDEFVLGKFIPKGNEFVFQETLVTKAIREGGGVVFEEINFARPQYLSFLYSLLDGNEMVMLDNGETVKRHPNFRFFATMNPGYVGTNELSPALLSRFNVVIQIDELSRDEIIKEVKRCNGSIDSRILNNVIDIYNRIKEKIKNEQLDTAISIRNLQNFAKQIKYNNNIRSVLIDTVVNPVAKFDNLLKKELEDIINIFFPN